ncbi:unnamed protein product [Citrullus colocynthis]|uniref:Transcription factor CBF/NF-Y/archaeal histone domain-containing protein n=1 Tax=Citrullus colocynthis TaxID=252529 RepID=A0ABP0Y1V3_9ROSI
MASSKKSSIATEAKSKEAGTSKPAPKTKTHNNARKSDNDDSKKKKKKKKKITTNNGSVKDNEALAISAPGGSASEEDDADEHRAETTSKKPNASKSKKVKRNHAKKEENGYAAEEEEAEEKICKFPMHRIKKIMRDENSDLRINQEALFLVNKASEMFLVQFCKDAYACCAEDRKKSLAYKHLSSVVGKRKRYDFLSDFVPEKLKFEDALKQRSMAESGKD